MNLASKKYLGWKMVWLIVVSVALIFFLIGNIDSKDLFGIMIGLFAMTMYGFAWKSHFKQLKYVGYAKRYIPKKVEMLQMFKALPYDGHNRYDRRTIDTRIVIDRHSSLVSPRFVVDIIPFANNDEVSVIENDETGVSKYLIPIKSYYYFERIVEVHKRIDLIAMNSVYNYERNEEEVNFDESPKISFLKRLRSDKDIAPDLLYATIDEMQELLDLLKSDDLREFVPE